MYAPKFVQTYEDFTPTSEGWSYKDVKKGTKSGDAANDGDRVVFDWSGYTIGYFGRPFEAKGGPQGGAFDKDLDYFRTVLGSKTMITGLECALKGMHPGDIRQVIVPYGPLSYPPEDKDHDRVGPKPTSEFLLLFCLCIVFHLTHHVLPNRTIHSLALQRLVE
jgi:FKBP-type peptidyl-prolyl cis-trans isomerase